MPHTLPSYVESLCLYGNMRIAVEDALDDDDIALARYHLDVYFCIALGHTLYRNTIMANNLKTKEDWYLFLNCINPDISNLRDNVYEYFLVNKYSRNILYAILYYNSSLRYNANLFLILPSEYSASVSKYYTDNGFLARFDRCMKEIMRLNIRSNNTNT